MIKTRKLRTNRHVKIKDDLQLLPRPRTRHRQPLIRQRTQVRILERIPRLRNRKQLIEESRPVARHLLRIRRQVPNRPSVVRRIDIVITHPEYQTRVRIVVWRVDDVVERGERGFAVVDGVSELSAPDGALREGGEVEAGYDAKVVAAAFEGAEQRRVGCGVGVGQVAGGEDDLMGC